MPRRIRVGRQIGGMRLDEMQDALTTHPVVLAGSTFVLGLIAGMMLKDAATRMYERTRNGVWHREYDTVEYDENLPESLTRREPAPDTRQPRFGGTGAIGVPPSVLRTARPEENR
jgi:hypothetical protein